MPPPSNLSKIHFNIIPLYTWIFQVTSFPQVSPLKPCMHLFYPSYMLHVLPIQNSFPLLSSYRRISLIPRLLWIFCNIINFLRWGVVSTSPNPQPGGPLLVSCLQLLIQYVQSYPPHLESVPPTATWGCTMPWWRTHLSWKQYLLTTVNSYNSE
jgi:hypothetical protein